MSSPLTLELTRHELFSLPPDTPAIGEAFRVEVSSSKRPTFVALARLVMLYPRRNETNAHDHYRVFFRREEGPENEIFSSERVDYVVNAAKDSSPHETLLKRLREGANEEKVFRYWQPPDLTFGLVLKSTGWGAMLNSGSLSGWPDFRWHLDQDKAQFWKWNTHEFQEVCRQLVLDPDSEFNFFLKWENLSEAEKSAFVTTCRCGDWNLLLRLFTWVLQLITHHFGPFPDPEENPTNSSWNFSTSRTEARDDWPALSFAQRWRNALFAIVQPSFWPAPEPDICLMWRYRKTSGIENGVRCEIPTQHEVLEAQFGLREFLRPHLSAEEIEALFSIENL